MNEQHKEKIEEIIGNTICPKDFKCADSGFKVIGKVEDIGLKNYLECLEADSDLCKFSTFFGKVYYCQCPVRLYLAKELKI